MVATYFFVKKFVYSKL